MAGQLPPLGRKTLTPWDRLRPVKQDPLESMGFVSKGDTRSASYCAFLTGAVDRVADC